MKPFPEDIRSLGSDFSLFGFIKGRIEIFRNFSSTEWAVSLKNKDIVKAVQAHVVATWGSGRLTHYVKADKTVTIRELRRIMGFGVGFV